MLLGVVVEGFDFAEYAQISSQQCGGCYRRQLRECKTWRVVRMVVARIHESERVACFSEKYQSVTIIQHVSESGDRMMRCCRANKASGLHLAKAASKEAL